MTATDRVYCKWCGTAVTDGGLFCPSCGRDVERPEATSTTQRSPYRAVSYVPASVVDEPQESQGLFGRIASAVGGGIALLLALIVGLIGTILPILVIVALFMGPGDTWDMVTAWIPGGGNDNAACTGFDDWYEESADRSQQVVRMLDELDSGETPNPAALRSLATEVDVLASEQRRSSAPQEAVALNDMMVETLVLGADALRAIASSDQSGLQYFVNESDRLTPIYDNEEERVFNVCR